MLMFHILSVSFAPSAEPAAFIVIAPAMAVCPCIVRPSIALLLARFMPPLSVRRGLPG